MIFLNNATSDLLEVVTSTAASIDSVASYVDAAASGLSTPSAGSEGHNIGSAATTTILATPGASTTRTLKQLTLRNHDASLSCDVTVRAKLNATSYELHKVTLTPGDALEYIEGVGFFLLTNVSASVVDANANTGDVTANAANTYLTGSSLNTTGLLQAGSFFKWYFTFSKTGAGTATPIWTIVYGTNGTTGDTARCSFTLLAQTAATDTGDCWLVAAFRTIGASATLQAWIEYNHINTTTGLANVAQVQIKSVLSSAFDSTPSGSIIGVCCNPGSLGVWTFQMSAVTGHNLLKQR